MKKKILILLLTSSVCNAQQRRYVELPNSGTSSITIRERYTPQNEIYLFHKWKHGESPLSDCDRYDEMRVVMNGKTYQFKIKGYVSEFINDTGKVYKFPTNHRP